MFSKRLPIRVRFARDYYPPRVLFEKYYETRIFISLSLSFSLARQLAGGSNLKMLRAFPRVAYDFNDKIYGRPASHSRIYLAFRERATSILFPLAACDSFFNVGAHGRTKGREGGRSQKRGKGLMRQRDCLKKRRGVRYFSDVIFISP